jgi:hypothetical protein
MPKEIKGCTAGVIHIPGGIMFFKNRDLGQRYLVNRITAFQSTSETYALRGVNFETKGLDGVSVGVNKHKICVANTHIETTPDVTYDVLCERLVNETRGREDVPRIVEDFVEHNAVQGGRILVASPEWAYLIEVLKKTFKIQAIETDFVITNTFSLISHGPKRPKVRDESSVTRLETATRIIESISNVKALKSMLRSHVPEKGELSICNHRQDGGGTESSHIIQIQGDYVGWSSLVGYPCENDYHTIQLFQGYYSGVQPGLSKPYPRHST